MDTAAAVVRLLSQAPVEELQLYFKPVGAEHVISLPDFTRMVLRVEDGDRARHAVAASAVDLFKQVRRRINLALASHRCNPPRRPRRSASRLYCN